MTRDEALKLSPAEWRTHINRAVCEDVARIKIVCPNPSVPVYDALVDGNRIGSWSDHRSAMDGAKYYVRSHPSP